MPSVPRKQPATHPWKKRGALLREAIEDKRSGRDEYFTLRDSDYAYHRGGK